MSKLDLHRGSWCCARVNCSSRDEWVPYSLSVDAGSTVILREDTDGSGERRGSQTLRTRALPLKEKLLYSIHPCTLQASRSQLGVMLKCEACCRVHSACVEKWELRTTWTEASFTGSTVRQASS